ncbi:MAG: hypothetical protein ACRDPI_00715 [Nocardioidaceae bacterium]
MTSAALVVGAFGLVAVAAGGPVTALVLRLVDRGLRPLDHSVEEASHLLRGGAWIGGLERIAVYVSVVAGWPEGIAVALALKSFGRYPELKTSQAGTAERFIIGTFTSVLWAVAFGGLARALR